MMSEHICLINPPFGAIEHPSIALGLLQASARKAGYMCRTIYANLSFAEQLGPDLYLWLSRANGGDLLGEWVFVNCLFKENPKLSDEYIKRFIKGSQGEIAFKSIMPSRDFEQSLHQARNMAANFVDQLAHEVISMRPGIVGCTSLSLQNCAALAILKRIHELDGSVVTLLGGANCEGPMAYALRRAFPWVDFVVSGEAENIFPDLLRLLLEHGKAIDEKLLPDCIIGSSRSMNSSKHMQSRAVVSDLDTTAPPDYNDYFDQLSKSSLSEIIMPGLLLETSRGCWYGEKNRCTFCGLNGLSLNHRSKSPERVVEEIDSSCAKHQIEKIEFVDNNLHPNLADEIFNTLAKRPNRLSLMFETRVINKRQITLMARGGVKWMQVGIESLHAHLLSLMSKGSSVLQNIQVLRTT
jgi:magnesium-protoporphyrin IX monomethyl ester (oxidative) cyclase